MVRTLALGFGAVTALAVAGSMTPTGQAMLGMRHPAEKVTPVTVIQDKPAAIPAPAQSLPAQSLVEAPTSAPTPTSVHPQPSSSAAHAQPPAGAPQSRPTRPTAQRPPATQQQMPQQGGQGGPGGLAGVANILLNLPQILDQTHVGPAQHEEESKPEEPQQPPKRYKNQQWEKHKEAGDDN